MELFFRDARGKEEDQESRRLCGKVKSTFQWTLRAVKFQGASSPTRARRRVPGSWLKLVCVLAWSVLATCSPRSSYRLRRRSTQRASRTCCARTTSRGRRRSAEVALSSSRTGLRLAQVVPLVLCLVRWSVKLRLSKLTTLCESSGEALVAKATSTDDTTLRAAIIKTHAKISGDEVKCTIPHFTRRFRLRLAADGDDIT